MLERQMYVLKIIISADLADIREREREREREGLLIDRRANITQAT